VGVQPVELRGLIVAITGAGRGIGLATARRLAAAGASVAIGDVDERAAAAARDALGGSALAHRVDVRDEDSFRSFLNAVADEFGALDVLVNNAGIMPVGPLLDESAAEARRMFDVNVHGVLNGTKLAVPLLAGRASARIVNVASYAGKLAVPGQVTYAATKAAVLAICEGSRWELEPRGIGVTAVIPSFTNTELIAGTAPIKSVVPVEPDAVAQAIVDAVAHGKDEVYVPKQVKPVGALIGALPRRWRQALHRRLGTDRAFLDLDREQRRAYLERTASLGDGSTSTRPEDACA
jgi:NAD(P)-dependent dehydrogenase (short-subunit alcohol dehydrogenase family)